MRMFPVDLNDPETSIVELAVLLSYMERIVDAVDRRDRHLIPGLLAETTATHLPREVREELSMFAAQSRNGFRAPIRFLRFRFRMLQLAAGDEPIDHPQLELDLGRGAGWRGLSDSRDDDWDDIVDRG